MNTKFYGVARFPLDAMIPGRLFKLRSNVFPNKEFDDWWKKQLELNELAKKETVKSY